MICRLFQLFFVISFLGGIQGFGQDLLPSENDKNLAEIEIIVADFIAEDTVVTAGNPLAFTNLSSGNPTFFQWNIEGGSPSITYSKNPLVMFYTPGIFDVQLIVSGVNGSDTIIKEDYIHVLEEQTQLPPGWDYNPTFSQHSIIILLESNPRIFEVPIECGDYIGVFYHDDDDNLKCGGAVEWDGAGNTALTSQGDNPFTGPKDGFAFGELFTWKLYSWEHAEEFQADVNFRPDMPFNMFIPGAISITENIAAGTVFEITIPQGWSGLSSPVQPWYSNLHDVFNGQLDEVEMVFDGTGFFRPDQNLNTIGGWQNKGYQIKLKNSITVEIGGYPVNPQTIDVEAGLNILPVPVSCPVDINDLFGNNLSKVIIIREIAGTAMFWPEYGMNTLQSLEPGKAYILSVSSGFTIDFGVCE
jgi:PKD repeat protein